MYIFLTIITITLLYICVCDLPNLNYHRNYNKGICKKCGGHYEIDDTSWLDGTTEFVYICDNCGDELHYY